MVAGMDFVSLPVSDMHRAKAFYQDVLGLTPGTAGEGPWVEFEMGDGPALALIDPAAMGRPMVPSAAGTVAIAFRDFNGMVETLKAQDLLQQEPFESPVCHGAFVLDPDGNSLSLHQRKGETERDRVIDFVGMPVQDMERARAFYEGMLGLKPGDIASAAWIEYDLPDDTALALCDVRVMGLEFQPIQAGGMALRTPDLEAVFARLKQAGHAVAEDVIETSVCHMAMVKDSEGNAFLLHRHK